MNDQALLVLNERARGATQRAALTDAIRVLEHAYRVRVVSPSSPAELAQAVCAAPEPLVIAAGGDGTVNHVVAALRPDAALAILPIGTANDFACEVGVPLNLWRAAGRIAGSRTERAVDLVAANGRPFCTVGGVGLVARTTISVLRAKERSPTARAAAQALGGFIYKLAAAATIVAGRDLVDTIRLRYRDAHGAWQERTIRAHTLFVVNHRLCGGGLALPTSSRGDDGIFELGVVHAGSRPALAVNFSRLAASAAIPADVFEVIPATEAEIDIDHEVPFVADGELLEMGQRFHITVRPGALRLMGA